MERLKLSVIVPVFNVEKYILRCLESLVEQDIPSEEYEVIIINDGSTDNSFQLAKTFIDGRDNFRLYSQPNGGLSAARNTGLRHAKGKYIFYVDSDDFVEKKLFQCILNIAETNNLDICFFKPMVLTDGGKIIRFGKPRYADGIVYSGEYLLMKGVAMTSVWHAFYKKTFLDNTGIIFSEGLIHEDLDYHLKIFPFARRIMLNNIDGYYYCQNGESILRTSNSQKIIKLFESEFMIIRHVKDHSEEHSFSNEVYNYYQRHTNSMLVGAIVNIIQNPNLSYNEKRSLMKFAKEQRVYPYWGITMSWKTTLLLYAFNVKTFLKLLFRIKWFQKPVEPQWK